MKWKRTSWWVLITFFCFIIGPLFTAAPAQAATMADLVNEMNLVYSCIDDTYVDGSGKTDKDYMQDARTASQSFAALGYEDPDWAAILDPLVDGLNSTAAGQQAITDLGGETVVRETFVAAFSDLSQLYYTSDTTELETRLTTFKNDYRTFFLTLMGNDLTVDRLSDFLITSRSEFQTAINHSLTSGELTLLNGKSLKAALLYGTNQELIDAMPILIKYAMYNVLETPEYTDLDQRLAAIGWSVDLLIDQFKMVSEEVDSEQKAQLGLALASVRSQSELFDLVSDPTALTPIANNAITCTVGDDVSLQLQIMATDLTGQVDYTVAGTNPTAITITDDQGNTIDFSATSPGTATLVLYRQNGVAEHDWIAKLDVTVTGIYGDVTGEGEITITDAVKVLKHITDGITLNAQEQILGDVNGDDAVTITDAVLVLKHITDPDIPFPVENP
ncbi:MAG: dockerin type I repeat-containing protein [Syntrophomonadaceae bacterium]|jgi:hypothetical protein